MQPQLAALLKPIPNIRHIQIEDGPGRPLGRSFQVKLWPTLVFLRNGQVVKQFARPDLPELREGIEALSRAGDLR